MRDLKSFREGQRAAFEVAMTVFCSYCHAGYYGKDAQNDIARDGGWLNGDMKTGIHVRDGRRHRCASRKLIPLFAFIRPLPPHETTD